MKAPILQFPIYPINHFDSTIMAHWHSQAWKITKQEQNPSDDEFIGRLQLMRFNLLRQIWIRNDNAQRKYWRYMPRVEQLTAQAECEAYESLHADLFALEMRRNVELGLQSGINYLDSLISDRNAFAAFNKLRLGHMQRQATMDSMRSSALESGALILPGNVQRAVIGLGTMTQLFPLNHPTAVNEYNSLIHPDETTDDLPWIPQPSTPEQIEQLTQWRELAVPVQYSAVTSFEFLCQDIAMAAVDHNVLSGQLRASHMMLINDKIPLPSLATFHGWASHSVIAFRSLIHRETMRFARLSGGTPTHIMTYLAPNMPMTKEHASGNLITTDDSHTDHSLPTRNTAHLRDSRGRVSHGIWRVSTVLLDSANVDFVHRVADEDLLDGGRAGLSLHESHCDMLPNAEETEIMFLYGGLQNRDVFLDGMHISLTNLIQSPVMNPFMHGMYRMRHNFQMTRVIWDIAYRALSKFYGLHFRFDSSDLGEEALHQWQTAFESAASQWIASTAQERTTAYFDRVYAGQNTDIIADASKKRKAGSWDLSSLGLKPNGSL